MDKNETTLFHLFRNKNESVQIVQTSILYDKSKRMRYGLPSRMSKHARKIYDILEVTRRCTPYIIGKQRERIPSVLEEKM